MQDLNNHPEPGGLENIISILKGLNPEEITRILNTLKEKDKELAAAIKKQLQGKE